MKEISLIGSTGFLGKTLQDIFQFTMWFDSKNIQTIGIYDHDTIYCCAPSAEKWRANLQPEEDLKSVQKLIESLSLVNKNANFILFSTIDIYGDNPQNVDEDFSPTQLPSKYGLHRYFLEQFVAENFENHFIVRLPGLFGKHMKKNVIFDILNNNTSNNPVRLGDSFQWFPIKRIKEILYFVQSNSIRLLNVATEPVSNRKLLQCFDSRDVIDNDLKVVDYNVKSLYFQNGYFLNESQVLQDLKKFVDEYRNL